MRSSSIYGNGAPMGLRPTAVDRSTMVRMGVLVGALLLIAQAALFLTRTQAAESAAPAACATAGDRRFDALRAELDGAVTAGKLSRATADTYACDPAQLM